MTLVHARLALASLLVTGCCPDDPRKDPAGVIEVSRKLGDRIDRDRALAGFRTREEFIRHLLENYVSEMEAERRRDPDMFYGNEVHRLQGFDHPVPGSRD